MSVARHLGPGLFVGSRLDLGSLLRLPPASHGKAKMSPILVAGYLNPATETSDTPGSSNSDHCVIFRSGLHGMSGVACTTWLEGWELPLGEQLRFVGPQRSRGRKVTAGPCRCTVVKGSLEGGPGEHDFGPASGPKSYAHRAAGPLNWCTELRKMTKRPKPRRSGLRMVVA